MSRTKLEKLLISQIVIITTILAVIITGCVIFWPLALGVVLGVDKGVSGAWLMIYWFTACWIGVSWLIMGEINGNNYS